MIGSDQPLLCGIYVDRRIAAIQIVQILSRLNGAHPDKHRNHWRRREGPCGAPTGPRDPAYVGSTGDSAVFEALSLWVDSGLDDPSTPSTITIVDFALASSLMGWGADFFKADHGPIPAHARWITVHPNGEGTKGAPFSSSQPVISRARCASLAVPGAS